MPRTILCQKCGIVLNIPSKITAGKRMKCPKCAHRFEVTERDANSASTFPGDADAAVASSHELARRPPSRDNLPVSTTKAPPGADDLLVSVADHDLRDVFDLPLGSGASIEKAAASAQQPVMSDAEALFHDQPTTKRKPKGAEARAQARRCSHCGGAVPMGMSICVACGVDQDTGMRVGLEDDLAPPPPPAPTGPPLHIAITGFLCGLAAGVLLLLSLIQSVRGEPGMTQYGWLCLALISAFGIYGAVQFYIGKTVKLLMLALTLGVFVDLAALIAVPVYQAHFADKEGLVASSTSTKDNGPGSVNDESLQIQSVQERLDRQKINLGLIVIGIYVLLSIYLMSSPVKRYFVRQTLLAGVPLALS
jgi:hypothetical protein